MSIIASVLVWVGWLCTGFNLSFESEHNQKSGGDLNVNGVIFLVRKKCKWSGKRRNKNKIRNASAVLPILVPFHWPFFTICVSLIQWACFLLQTKYAINNGWVSESIFEANHLKRYEVWRIVTSLFVHDGGFHFYNCLAEQLIAGLCLEIVHGWKPVSMLYFGGALVSDFWDLIGGTGLVGSGASGAISALYAGNLASIILNWKETSWAAFRAIVVLLYLISLVSGSYWYPIFVSLYGPDVELYFGEGIDTDISHAAHTGGVVGGFVFGICLLKNFRARSWQITISKIFRLIAIILVVIGVGSLFFNPLFYSLDLFLKKMPGLEGKKMQDLMRNKVQDKI